jgi:hypothetical protein
MSYVTGCRVAGLSEADRDHCSVGVAYRRSARTVIQASAVLLGLLFDSRPVLGQPFERGPIPSGTAFIGLTMHDPEGFARAMERGNIHAIDRWMKRELMAQKKGEQVDNGSAMITVHTLTYNSIVDWLRKQPGVIDAAWDGCVGKLDIWPGHSTIGVRVRLNGVEYERCYRVQEGIPGTVNLFGWRPKLRRSREHLKFLGAAECPGFVGEQRRHCAERGR